MSDATLETQLTELQGLAQEAGRLALDTEFMGEGRYRTLLCLVQVSVAEGSSTRIEIIDPLPEDLDFGPLASVLADPSIEVVLHAGRQDIALLRRCLQTEVTNIFDTQVAAGFAGLPAQSSYEALLSELLGVRLAKSASFTRW
ncbi:MAG TPA: ribonuclease D, partial [Solirubrobacteraceae bacterium]